MDNPRKSGRGLSVKMHRRLYKPLKVLQATTTPTRLERRPQACYGARKRTLPTTPAITSAATYNYSATLTLMEHQIEPLLPECLPAWSQHFRGMPNAIARSALFNISSVRKGERTFFSKAEIASTQGISLLYTGSELRQDDLDVFLQVLHMAKEQKLGEDIQFTAHSMIVALKWTINPASYERLSDAMNRMKATALRLTVEDGKGGRMSFTGSLMGEFTWRETGSDDPLRLWTVSLEKNIVKLFAPDAYSMLNWATRLSLSPLAKWLQTFYSTHKQPFALKIETLHKLTASQTKEVRKFKVDLKKALAALVDCGFFLSAKVDDKSGLVTVERKADRKALE